MCMDRPSANGCNSDGTATRDGGGRFLTGNKAAVGRDNPHAAQVNAWRRALAVTVSEEDLRAVIAKLVERAKAGERWAVCELLDRCLGKPMHHVESTGTVAAEDVTLRLVFDSPSLDPPRARPALRPAQPTV